MRLTNQEIENFNKCANDVFGQLNRRWLAEGRNLLSSAKATFESNPQALLIPGAFYKEKKLGGDGKRIIEIMKEYNIATRTVELDSFNTAKRNRHLILKAIEKNTSDNLIIISLSKGSFDFAQLVISADPAESEIIANKVKTWVNISGIITGTPLIQAIKKEKARMILIKLLFRIRGYSFDALNELQYEPKLAQDLSDKLPSSIQLLNIYGIPFFEDLSSALAKRSVVRLKDFVASDGGGVPLNILPDLPGVTLPLRHFDHYLKDINFDVLLSGKELCYSPEERTIKRYSQIPNMEDNSDN